MSWPSSNRISDLLGSERPLLDEIFGRGKYEIDDVDPDVSIVRSAVIELKFGFDRHRARDIVTTVTIVGVPQEISLNSLDVLARFIGEDIPPLPTNANGVVSVPPDEQIRKHLRCVLRLAEDVFTDPQKTRDAAIFGAGYNSAYNDWASGKGSWLT